MNVRVPLLSAVLAVLSLACRPPSGGLGSNPNNPTGNPTGSPSNPVQGACLVDTALQSLGQSTMLVGAMMEDNIAASAPFSLRYAYLSYQLAPGSGPCSSCSSGCSSGWWGCWNPTDPPGAFARDFITQANKDHQLPMFTYYLMLASGPEGTSEVTAANDPSFMSRYLADWRFLLQQVGSSTVLLHLEPDFWAYAQFVNSDPHQIPAAITTSNPTDCANQENSIAGMARCMIAMARKYAPNAKVALHASDWATQIDAFTNTDPQFDVAGNAKQVADFLKAAAGDSADFVVVDPLDRDAGYYTSIGQNRWWDATNQTLPDFTQAFAWSKALSEELNRASLWWQIPVGNMSQNNTTNHWQDNRVDYLLGHTADVTKSHIFGLAFGAGADNQTNPSTDGGNLLNKVRSYAAAGGQVACP